MKKIIGAFIALGAIISPSFTNKEALVCFESNCFNVEVVSTDESRREGLMFRDGLDSDSGMLFVFDDSGFYDFWMKNMSIALDIIWIDENGRVVYVSENAAPCLAEPCASISPDKEAKYVLEINGGLASELQIKEDDIADLQY